MSEERTLADLLRDLPDGQPVTLGALLAATGARSHGAALLMLSLPEALPLPVPSFGAILGVPLLVVSAHLALFGQAGVLPRRLQGWKLPPMLTAALRGRVADAVRCGEAISRPRWLPLARMDRFLGMTCVCLSILLLVPLPLFNVPPALCLALIAWGMLQRDGLAIAAGLGATALILLILAGLADWFLALL